MLFRHIKTLLEVSEAQDTDETGSSYVIAPSASDSVEDHSQAFRVFFDATQANGATSPTTDVHLQTSHDGTNWFTIHSATQLTADGSLHEWEQVTALGPYVRAITTLAGGTNPDHTAKVVLASTSPFSLTAV